MSSLSVGPDLVELFGPVRTVNAYEETIARLLQQIRLGLVAPGSALPPERELAGLLGVSRDTVREAISELNRAGYVRSRRGRYGGTFVVDQLPEAAGTTRGADELDDIFGLREVLETGAARRAAGRTLTVAERSELFHYASETSGAEPADYRRLDSRLHLAIAQLSGLPSLVRLVAENRMQVNALLDAIPQLRRNIAHSDEQHAKIVRAILAGDADAAAAAVREHLSGSATLLRAFLG